MGLALKMATRGNKTPDTFWDGMSALPDLFTICVVFLWIKLSNAYAYLSQIMEPIVDGMSALLVHRLRGVLVGQVRRARGETVQRLKNRLDYIKLFSLNVFKRVAGTYINTQTH